MKVVAFSGGCFSGKTTAINALADMLMHQGVEVHRGAELVRNNAQAVDIDEMRADPNQYLKFELDIINAKIQYEQSLKDKFSDDCVILLDRALTDSLMYFSLYTDINKLKDSCLDQYQQFRSYLSDAIQYSFKNIYTHLFEFMPLNATCYKESDIMYRPKRVDTLKYIEYETVKELNECYYNRTKACKYVRTQIDASLGIEHWLAKFLYYNPDIRLVP